MATFTRSPQATHDLLVQVIQECYPDLEELMSESERIPLTFDLLDVFADLDSTGEPVGPAIKSGGYPVAAQISLVSKADRALGRADVLIKIDADGWKDLSDERRAGLLDHELYHLQPRKDKEEAWKKDDLGRQMFAMRSHDVQVGWFIEVAKRRGENSPEVRQAKIIADKWGQILFFFGETAPLPLTSEKPQSRRQRAIGGAQVDAATEELAAGKEAGANGSNGHAAEAPAGRRWLLWEQLDGAQQEAATELLGERLNTRFEFCVDGPEGLEQRPTGETPAEDPEAAAASKAAKGKTPRRTSKKAK